MSEQMPERICAYLDGKGRVRLAVGAAGIHETQYIRADLAPKVDVEAIMAEVDKEAQDINCGYCCEFYPDRGIELNKLRDILRALLEPSND